MKMVTWVFEKHLQHAFFLGVNGTLAGPRFGSWPRLRFLEEKASCQRVSVYSILLKLEKLTKSVSSYDRNEIIYEYPSNSEAPTVTWPPKCWPKGSLMTLLLTGSLSAACSTNCSRCGNSYSKSCQNMSNKLLFRVTPHSDSTKVRTRTKSTRWR